MKTRELIQALTDLKNNFQEIRRIQIEAARLDGLIRDTNLLHRTIIRELESRDVVQSGNMGWENRTTYFLIEMLNEAQGLHDCPPGEKI